MNVLSAQPSPSIGLAGTGGLTTTVFLDGVISYCSTQKMSTLISVIGGLSWQLSQSSIPNIKKNVIEGELITCCKMAITGNTKNSISSNMCYPC